MKKLIVFAIAVVVCWQVGAAVDGLKVGFSRMDITPPYGVFMPGYYVDRHVKGVLDPLVVNMIAF